jgi:DNA-binding GntR family transcriptional regulator
VPAKPPTLRVAAYESFRQQLLSANIRPGQFISQRELVALIGMPLGAIREMIPRLEADGLIRTVPQRGMQIAQIDVKLVRNAFQLRLILEKEAAAHFAAAVSDAELAGIEAAHRDIIRRARGRISDRLLDDAQTVDWGLHDLMIDSLGNEIVSSVYRVNSLKIRLMRLDRSVITPDRLLPAMTEHLHIIDALKTRNAPRVVEALVSHIDSARSRVLDMQS